MKRLIFITIVCAFVAAPAVADMRIAVDTNAGVGHASGGGEFGVTVLGLADLGGDPIGIYGVGETFHTFCVEKDEYVSAGISSYYVTLSDSAIGGGVGGSSPDPLSDESAWLYSQWLDNSNILIPHTATYANAVQEAIWYLEAEITSAGWLATTLMGYASGAVAGGWLNTDIMVMNLWLNPDHSGVKQDMLVRVPVPAAVLLGMLGLGIAGWKLRKVA